MRRFELSKVLKVGAHSSIAKGFLQAVQSVEDWGGNAVQIFLKSPRSYRHTKQLTEEEALIVKMRLQEKDIFLIGHCSYLLNFAKPLEDFRYVADSLVDDMKKIYALGGVGIVLHIGKYLDMSKQESFANIKQSLEYVLDATPQGAKIVLENTAGQGTEIGFRLSELAELFDALERHPRIGFCLDTCHAFAAGYDLGSSAGAKSWLQEFDERIGLERLVCFHLNDAKKEVGSRVDRHEDLGQGKIGLEGIKQIVGFAYQNQKPLILETPAKLSSYSQQIQMVRGFLHD